MFDWLKNWRKGPKNPPPSGPQMQRESTDWVVLPFRIAEACRLSMCIIAQHPDMPKHIQHWITQWLAGYNGALMMWFEQNYGKDVFPILNQITENVRALSDEALREQVEKAIGESFKRWESELREGDDDTAGK